LAERLYRHFAATLGGRGTMVKTGSFGAEMDVELVNHGPFTVILDAE
jgi:D-tyrosyl-tRNA(Tyr) deacylase